MRQSVHPGEPRRIPWRRALFGIDPRALAAFRITLALLLIVDLVVRGTDLVAMYTDGGMFSRATICQHFSAWSWSFHFASGEWPYQAMLFGLAAACAAALLVGWETRLAAVASWLLLVSVQNRVPHVLTGADNLLRMLLFWGMFLPLGRVWSVDARRARRKGRPPPGGAPVTSMASAAILLQMAFVYLFSAVFKTNEDWLQGRAVAATLADGFYAKPIGLALLQLPGLLAAVTAGILALEWLGPLLLFSPIATAAIRSWVVALLAAMHLGIEVLMNVGLFSFVSLGGLLLFLPPRVWDRLEHLRRGARAAAKTVDAAASAPTFDAASAPAPALVFASALARAPSIAASAACALALVFVLFANLNELPDPFVPWTRAPRLEPLTVSLGLGQKWDMFATAPSGSGWYVAHATLEDGGRIDLLRGGEPVTWEKPPNPAAIYPNHRWRKCFREMAYADARGYQVFRRPVAEHLCRAWNRRHPPGKRVAALALVLCRDAPGERGAGEAHLPRRETLVHLEGSAPRAP